MKSLSVNKLSMFASMFASISLRALAAFLAVSVAVTQTAFAAGPQIADQQAPAAPSQTAPPSATIDVPAGTVIPLTLVSQIKSKSTKVGDTVRAQVAFPITAGEQVAIPAGTYVEGVVTSLTAMAKKSHQPEVQIHFTQLVYANGYVAPLDAINMQASNQTPDAQVSPQFAEATLPPAAGASDTHIAFYGGEGFASMAQVGYPPLPPLPPLPPQPRLGPSPVLVTALMVGATVLFLVVGALIMKHHIANTDFVLYDSGWQFQMTLSTPLEVDEGQAIAAEAIPAR